MKWKIIQKSEWISTRCGAAEKKGKKRDEKRWGRLWAVPCFVWVNEIRLVHIECDDDGGIFASIFFHKFLLLFFHPIFPLFIYCEQSENSVKVERKFCFWWWWEFFLSMESFLFFRKNDKILLLLSTEQRETFFTSPAIDSWETRSFFVVGCRWALNYSQNFSTVFVPTALSPP